MTGLTAEDFQLFVDNDPVLLTSFMAVTDGLQSTSQILTPTQGAEPTDSPQSAVLGLSTADLSPLHLVIYVDNLYTRPGGRQRVLKQLRKYVRKQLQPQTRVMIVNYDRSLNVHLPFTTDKLAIEQALTELLDVPATGFRQDRLRQDVMGQAQSAGCEQGAGLPSQLRGTGLRRSGRQHPGIGEPDRLPRWDSGSKGTALHQRWFADPRGRRGFLYARRLLHQRGDRHHHFLLSGRRDRSPSHGMDR